MCIEAKGALVRRIVGLLMVVVLVAGCGGGIGEGGVVLGVPDGTDPEVLDQAIEIMMRRIETLDNVMEPEITVTGGKTVTVRLPGVTDSDRAVSLITSPGRLSFRPVLEASTDVPTDQIAESVDPTQQAWLRENSRLGGQVYLVGPAGLTGADIDDAVSVVSAGTSLWQVQLDFTNHGSEKFQELTMEAASYPTGDPRRQIAIVLDGEVVSAPYVSESVDPNVGIDSGVAVITVGTGDNQQQEAQDLAAVLRYGSLPVEFEIVSVSLAD